MAKQVKKMLFAEEAVRTALYKALASGELDRIDGPSDVTATYVHSDTMLVNISVHGYNPISGIIQCYSGNRVCWELHFRIKVYHPELAESIFLFARDVLTASLQNSKPICGPSSFRSGRFHYMNYRNGVDFNEIQDEVIIWACNNPVGMMAARAKVFGGNVR